MNWKIDWKKVNWRKVAIDIGMGVATAAVASYVLIRVLQHLQDALLECQGPCTVLNTPLDTVGLLKIGVICVAVGLICVIIVEAAGRYGNRANTGVQA